MLLTPGSGLGRTVGWDSDARGSGRHLIQVSARPKTWLVFFCFFFLDEDGGLGAKASILCLHDLAR